MPVVGVASKLRQPSVGSRPVHTALPIPNPGRTPAAKGHMPRAPELRGSESPMLSPCHLSLKADFQERRTQLGRSKETEESKICKVSVGRETRCHPGAPIPFGLSALWIPFYLLLGLCEIN
ncbi:hypothetical protein DPEC_G00115960 [Dallia pectoralis]|uniref:Uncharacterized protein n=1 Tax=Dallia pectoralis TaxID=75939 RepID=A0ACC2GUG5_DALPE|nr:hypothetical protein DPEC_G00115960 [Dallia pectoralis]